MSKKYLVIPIDSLPKIERLLEYATEGEGSVSVILAKTDKDLANYDLKIKNNGKSLYAQNTLFFKSKKHRRIPIAKTKRGLCPGRIEVSKLKEICDEVRSKLK